MYLVTWKLSTSSSPKQNSKTTDRLWTSDLVIGDNNTNLICAALYLI